MIAPRLAWRNLRRNRRRTALTISALAIGLTVLIISMGLLDGVDQQSIENLINYDLGYAKGFAKVWLDQDFPDLDYTISASDSLLGIIRNLEDISGAAQRLEMSGMLIFGREEVFARIVGIDPKSDLEVFRTLEAVTAGKTISTDEPVALIGDRLAKDIGVGVGDIVTIFVRSAPGALNPRMLPVAGIISTGHPKVDQLTVYIPLSTAREIALLPGSATEIAVRAKDISSAKLLNIKLKENLPEFIWRSWQQLADDFIQLARMKQTGSGIMIGIITLVAAVGLGNTMIMSVHERTREIGALRAMGFSSRLISTIFLCEGLLIGVIAGVAAVILGSAIISYIGVKGISLATYEGIDIGYPIQDAMYPILSVVSLAKAFIFGLIISILASWGAAKRAARGQVVRALREGML